MLVRLRRVGAFPKWKKIRGQLVAKIGCFNRVLLAWGGVSAVDSARLSDCPTSSIPTAPTNNQSAHASAQATVPEDIYNNLHQMN